MLAADVHLSGGCARGAGDAELQDLRSRVRRGAIVARWSSLLISGTLNLLAFWDIASTILTPHGQLLALIPTNYLKTHGGYARILAEFVRLFKRKGRG